MGISGSQALTSCMPCQRANSLATLAEGYGEIGPEIKKAARGDFDYHVISALLVEAAWIRILASEDGAVGLRYANPTYATLPCRVWREVLRK